MVDREDIKRFLEEHRTEKAPTLFGVEIDDTWSKEDLLLLINYLGNKLRDAQ